MAFSMNYSMIREGLKQVSVGSAGFKCGPPLCIFALCTWLKTQALAFHRPQSSDSSAASVFLSSSWVGTYAGRPTRP